MSESRFRALCTELLAAFEIQLEEMSLDNRLCKRARAELATSPPEPPTDVELLRLYGVATPCYHVEEYKRELNFARAVLERWG